MQLLLASVLLSATAAVAFPRPPNATDLVRRQLSGTGYVGEVTGWSTCASEGPILTVGDYELYLQPADGNFVVYEASSTGNVPVWTAGIGNSANGCLNNFCDCTLQFQASDGNLVVYATNSAGSVYSTWATATSNVGAYYLWFRDFKPYLVIETSAGAPVWESSPTVFAKGSSGGALAGGGANNCPAQAVCEVCTKKRGLGGLYDRWILRRDQCDE